MKFSASKVLLLLIVINFFNYVDRYVLSAVLEPIGNELNLNDQQLGVLGSAFLMVYMCAAPFFGYIADKTNRPKVLAAAIALWSLATTLTAFADSYEHLLWARAAVGIGEAAYAGIGAALLADLFDEDERTAKFTWFYLAIPVGSALGYALGGSLAGLYGWRTAFFVAGLPGLVLAFLMLMQTDPERGKMDSQEHKEQFKVHHSFWREIFGNRVWLACTACYAGYSFAMGAMTIWIPTLFQRRYNISTAEAGMMFGGMAIVSGIIGTLAGGEITKRFQKRWRNIGIDLSIGTLLLAAPAVALCIHSQSDTLGYLGIFFGMLFLFVNTSPVNVLLVSNLPPSVRASGISLNVFLIHALGDAVSPIIVGSQSDRLGGTGDALASALNVCIPAILFAAVALYFARSKAPRHAS